MTSPSRAFVPPLTLLVSDLDHLLRNHGLGRRDPATARPVRALTAKRLAVLVFLLGGIYGVSLGSFGLFHGGELALAQVAAAGIKLPLVFALTLVVTFPSLYVFATLLRLPLGGKATLRALLGAIAVNMAVLASLGPVFVFFAASTSSYPFLLLLNVAMAGAGGVISLLVLRRIAQENLTSDTASRRLLLAWCTVYGGVGAQMAWLMRPFLGSPGAPFALLRPHESNFFECVLRSLGAWVAGA